jgi:hypothetical protein
MVDDEKSCAQEQINRDKFLSVKTPVPRRNDIFPRLEQIVNQFPSQLSMLKPIADFQNRDDFGIGEKSRIDARVKELMNCAMSFCFDPTIIPKEQRWFR